MPEIIASKRVRLFSSILFRLKEQNMLIRILSIKYFRKQLTRLVLESRALIKDCAKLSQNPLPFYGMQQYSVSSNSTVMKKLIG